MRSRYFNALAAALLLCTAAPPARTQARASNAGRVQSQVVYTCPMHPEVKSKKKGQCSKCKMELRPARTEAANATTEAVPAATTPAAAPDQPRPAARMSIPDVALLDQDGRPLRFYTDLVRGKVVVVNFIFTTCTTICPPLGATFARLQKELGARAGRDVQLISISVDPATDTPERLKAWGEKFHAGPGWTLVTGAKPQVDELLRALGAATASPQEHSPTVLVGNDAAGQWRRAYGLARPSLLLQLIEDAAAGRLDALDDAPAKESARP
jgi:protein SCO1/2